MRNVERLMEMVGEGDLDSRIDDFNIFRESVRDLLDSNYSKVVKDLELSGGFIPSQESAQDVVRQLNSPRILFFLKNKLEIKLNLIGTTSQGKTIKVKLFYHPDLDNRMQISL